MDKLKKQIPGVFFVFIIAMMSIFFNKWLSPYFQLEALTIGILLGMFYRNTWHIPKIFQEGVKFSLKKLLKVGIVLLGFKLNFAAIIHLGPKILFIVLVFVPFVLILSNVVGRVLKVDTKLSTLIGVGSSICGASAIVAMAPCIYADDDDSILAVSVVSFLGAIGVLVYSAISVFCGINDLQYGIWSGISLHGVAHALAAAFARGETAGEIGTFVKMTRVLMLVPTALVLSYIFNKKSKDKSQKVGFPVYVLYFIFAGMIASTGYLPKEMIQILSKMSSWLILMAMIAMGLMVDFKNIKKKGFQAVIVGTLIFGFISPLMYIVVLKYF